MKDLISDLGEIKIHRNLIRQIVENSALEIPGTASLGVSSRKWVYKLLNFFRINGVKIYGGEDLKIEVPINVRYGYNIPKVANLVQEQILKNLYDSLNIDSATIVIKVKGVEKRSLNIKNVRKKTKEIKEEQKQPQADQQ